MAPPLGGGSAGSRGASSPAAGPADTTTPPAYDRGMVGIAGTIAALLAIPLTIGTALGVNDAAQAKNARCVIRQQGEVAYAGPCVFIADQNGSFAVRRLNGQPLLPEITDVSVTLTAAGEAEVRGLTVHGINSRWGPARRNRRDRACWTGADFEVCAY